LSGLKVGDLRIWNDHTCSEDSQYAIIRLITVSKRKVTYKYVTWSCSGGSTIEFLLDNSKELTKLHKYLLTYENNNE
jgi:hypothetical protein